MLLAWNSLVLSQGWCSQCYERKPTRHEEALCGAQAQNHARAVPETVLD